MKFAFVICVFFSFFCWNANAAFRISASGCERIIQNCEQEGDVSTEQAHDICENELGLGDTSYPECESMCITASGESGVIPENFPNLCEVCTVGEYYDGDTCEPCPAGTYEDWDSHLHTSCKKCGFGEYAPEGSESCKKCPAGQYSDESGSASCTACSPGTYSSVAGSTSCTPCPVGEYSNSSGASSCTKCKSGTAQPNTGKTSCEKCEDGFYSSTDGATACTKCPEMNGVEASSYWGADNEILGEYFERNHEASCYIPGGTSFTDYKGTYIFEGDCVITEY